MLYLHNTLTRKKECFEPLDKKHIRMYVCGPTVYDLAHIGNARPVVVFDVLYRLLKMIYLKVTYVRNITDVDDKINAKAMETGEGIRTITERTANIFHKDMLSLNALDPEFEPRATDHIPEMIAMIKVLLEKQHAYEAEGHVLFSVSSWDGYGKLSGHNRDEIIAGARVEIAPYKQDAADFVLWKPSNDLEPGWNSPWGFGRPGWHLECSAMSNKYLGEEFDIHGGGQDLIFPHHENEIAQSRCSHGTDSMAKVWMHNGYLMVEGKKMSKSVGNFYTVNSLLEEFPGEAIRLALLSTHYRQPLNFTKTGIADAKRKLDGWYRLMSAPPDGEAVPEAVFLALSDDINTPQAISEMDNLANQARAGDSAARSGLMAAANMLGLLQHAPDVWFKGAGDEAAIGTLIARRLEARENKNFAESDRIRDELMGQGIVLEDGPEGTTWRRQ
jgi:cysteinyl-tRNA synthetase